MARLYEPDAEQVSEWNQWLANLPACTRVIAERFDPWTLYCMKSTGQVVYLQAFAENGTVRVGVSGRFNALAIDCSVVGVDPDDLMACDAPPACDAFEFYEITSAAFFEVAAAAARKRGLPS